MNLAALSIRRPIFIACLVILILAVGYLCLLRLPVDLFPNVEIPIVTVRTQYPGAGPEEIETQISKPLEDVISTVAGIDSLRSVSREGVSQIIAEFNLDVDVKHAEQQIRDRVSNARRRLPDDVEDSVIQTIDPADQPVLVFSLTADLSPGELYDLANDVIKPQLTQVNQVGLVEILGGRKREIRVELDRARLNAREISARQVAAQIGSAGKNIPLGKMEQGGGKEAVYRAVGEFRTLQTIENTIVRFTGNENPVTVKDLGRVVDSLQDEASRTFVNGKQSVLIYTFKQSKSNTIAVADGLVEKIDEINKVLKEQKGSPEIAVVRDGAARIRANVADVEESIVIGIILTVVVVFFFLGSGRSTIITGLALPNSLLGAFILMAVAGFSVNIMTLLALSLAVGLLIDDAIVVRENIFRHLEMGKDAHKAAYEGTVEVTLAVIATTFAILAVFGPIGFLDGVVGQYLKEFGLTMCFAMLISLFDALTIAPMLSAYFAGKKHSEKKPFFLTHALKAPVRAFDRFQTWLEDSYVGVLKGVLRFPILVILVNIGIFVGSLTLLKKIPKTFIPAQDNGEVTVNLDLPPGTSLSAMAELSQKVDEMIRQNKEVKMSVLTVGNRDGEPNASDIFVRLVSSKERQVNTSQFKDVLREQLKPFKHANPTVSDGGGGGGRQFNLNIVGTNLKEIEKFSAEVLAKIKNHPALKDVDTSFRPGKPEIQVKVNETRAQQLGIATATLGAELRTQIQGETPSVYRDADREYDVRVRVQEDQRDLRKSFASIRIPNINNSMIPLSVIGSSIDTTGPSTILRQDRARYVQISADLTPGGPGIGGAIADVTKLFSSEMKPPTGVSFSFVGQAKRFAELMKNMGIAMGLGIVFIFLVLASLYESFITPFAIMLVFPLAACGAFIALFLGGQSLDLFSMIGCVMLLGLATKNSILLVDYANQMLEKGMDRREAILAAGKTRLRPILMTTFALIAGMIPVAIGLNEASKQRTSLGVAIIGGTISSTLLALVVVPAAFSYIDRFRQWINKIFFKYIGSGSPPPIELEVSAPPLIKLKSESRREFDNNQKL